MASIKSVGFYSPKFMPGDGCAASLVDKVALTANPAVNDTIDFLIPAGLEVSIVEIQCDDIDTNGTPTFAFGVGYAPIQADTALTAAPTYFAAAGQTTARTGGRLACSFKPIKFEEDVILRLTVGAVAATFAAGEIHAVVVGACRGVR
jgi:hypothetical protein